MAVESAGDLAAMFDTADFAIAATYTPSGGAPAAVSILWDNPTETLDLGALGVAAPRTRALIRASEATGTVKGGTLQVGATVYTIRAVRPLDSDLVAVEVGP